MAKSYQDTDVDAGQTPADFDTVEGSSGERRESRGDTSGLIDGILILMVVLLFLSYAY
jgi:hypothetical protein